MIISLTGFMGCGKSSVGRRLSQLLCCRFTDLDSVIEDRTGRAIPEIFATDGEQEFRSIEKDCLKDVFFVTMANCSRGPLPLRGPLPKTCCRRLLAAKAHRAVCRIAREGGKMPLPQNSHAPQKIHSSEDTHILSLGGGTVMTRECAELVRDYTVCVYLRASVDTLVNNLKDETEGRPMLQNASGQSASPDQDNDSRLRTRIEELMAQRSATYESTARIIIDTDGRSIDSIAEEILSLL